MRLFIFSLMLTFATTATAQSTKPSAGTGGNGRSCIYTVNKDSGTVMFYSCDLDMMGQITEEARRGRAPNAGDFEELNKRLDRLIQLLEERK